VAGRGRRALLAAGVGGVIAGAALSLLFIFLHTSWTRIPGVTPDAQQTVPYWVPQYLAPVLISAGWTALTLHYRQVRRWALLSAAALALLVALVALTLFPIAIAGNGGVWVGNLTTPLLIAVMVGGPMVAIFRPHGRERHPADAGWYLAAGLLLPIAMFAGHVPFLGI
jgi:cytochrome bd-type quinol oxidase subunit 2